MKLTIDTEKALLTRETDGRVDEAPLYSPDAFSWLTAQWLNVGWVQRYTYQFSWLGRPIVQLPEDMVRMQELVVALRPDVIVETGIAHGGSLIFYASLCKLLGMGRVIGVDIEIRPHNRAAIEAHPLFPWLTLIEGSSTDPDVVRRVRSQISPGDAVLVILDSCHTKEHVLGELRAYAPLVTVGSYIVAMDGIMKDLAGAPRTLTDWSWNNPRDAAREFVAENPDFVISEPSFAFNESSVADRITYSPDGFIKRISG